MERTHLMRKDLDESLQCDVEKDMYADKAITIAKNCMKYDLDGRVLISKEDVWAAEAEWDEMYEELSKSEY